MIHTLLSHWRFYDISIVQRTFLEHFFLLLIEYFFPPCFALRVKVFVSAHRHAIYIYVFQYSRDNRVYDIINDLFTSVDPY